MCISSFSCRHSFHPEIRHYDCKIRIKYLSYKVFVLRARLHQKIV